MNGARAQGKDGPRVDVYVVHWCAPEWCARSVESLLGSVDVDLRCHVIDNGATGGAKLAAALPAGVEVITSRENLGYAGGANLGLAAALAAPTPPDYIVITAHDALVAPETLRECCAVAERDTTIGIVGPIITAPATIAGGTWRGWRAKGTSTWDEGRAFEDRDWISGTLLVIRPACAMAIGGLDAALGSYVEDVDYCLRARDAGWHVGIATAARASGIGAASPNVTVMIDVNSVIVAVKRRGLGAAVPIVGRYLYWAVRGVGAGALPGRDAARRRASLQHARDHVRAVTRLARGWRTIVTAARHPDAATPRFRPTAPPDSSTRRPYPTASPERDNRARNAE